MKACHKRLPNGDAENSLKKRIRKSRRDSDSNRSPLDERIKYLLHLVALNVLAGRADSTSRTDLDQSRREDRMVPKNRNLCFGP